MTNFRFGVLEFGYRRNDRSSLHALMDVMAQARLADQLGFQQFWLTEHHVHNVLTPWASPRVLLPLLLHETERIRVGMAGVLANFHSPYDIALDFKLLANLFHNRVDLGFANGRPALRIARQMRCEEFPDYPDDFDQRVARTVRLLNEEQTVLERERIVVPPAFGALPDLYQLGSSFRHWRTAVDRRMHMVKSTFHTMNALEHPEADEVARYRDAFAARHGYQPKVIMALAASCVPDEATRREVIKSMRQLHKGSRIVNAIIATPDELAERLEVIGRQFGVTDFVIREVGGDSAQQQNSLRLIASSELMAPSVSPVFHNQSTLSNA